VIGAGLPKPAKVSAGVITCANSNRIAEPIITLAGASQSLIKQRSAKRVTTRVYHACHDIGARRFITREKIFSIIHLRIKPAVGYWAGAAFGRI
jgi:hypothetical protein